MKGRLAKDGTRVRRIRRTNSSATAPARVGRGAGGAPRAPRPRTISAPRPAPPSAPGLARASRSPVDPPYLSCHDLTRLGWQVRESRSGTACCACAASRACTVPTRACTCLIGPARCSIACLRIFTPANMSLKAKRSARRRRRLRKGLTIMSCPAQTERKNA